MSFVVTISHNMRVNVSLIWQEAISIAKNVIINCWEHLIYLGIETQKQRRKRTVGSGMVDGDFENGRCKRADDCKAIL